MKKVRNLLLSCAKIVRQIENGEIKRKSNECKGKCIRQTKENLNGLSLNRQAVAEILLRGSNSSQGFSISVFQNINERNKMLNKL